MIHSGRWVLDIMWLFILLLVLAYFWRDRKRWIDAQSWLLAKAYINRFEWTAASHGKWPKIEYTFKIGEEDCTGNYLLFDTLYNHPDSKYSRLIAYKVAVAFQKSLPIEVHYNPMHPEQSALDVKVPFKLNFILVFFSLLFVVHLGIMILF